MFVYPHKYTVSVLSGSGADADAFKHEVLKQIIVTPPTESAVFSFDILDDDGVSVFNADSTGSLNEAVDMLLRGNHTIAISDASDDGNYAVKLMSYEPHG